MSYILGSSLSDQLNSIQDAASQSVSKPRELNREKISRPIYFFDHHPHPPPSASGRIRSIDTMPCTWMRRDNSLMCFLLASGWMAHSHSSLSDHTCYLHRLAGSGWRAAEKISDGWKMCQVSPSSSFLKRARPCDPISGLPDPIYNIGQTFFASRL